MSESVILPALGESVTEGTITRWFKNVGDIVAVDEPLLEVSTDKVDTEIPSPFAGTLEAILVQEDETVEVGTPLATIGDGSQTSAPAPAPAQPASASAASFPPAQLPTVQHNVSLNANQPTTSFPPTPPPSPFPTVAPTPPAPQAMQQVASNNMGTPTGSVPQAMQQTASAPQAQSPITNQGYTTPIVRKFAQEQGINLEEVSGTGVGGRIRREDILSAVQPSEASSVSSPPPAAISALRGTTQPMSRLRKVIAERSVASMQATAQLTTVVEVDVTAVAALRERLKASFLEKTGTKLSFLPFFTFAAVEALKTFPIINATVKDDSIVYPDHEHLAIAVDTERGLLTPVIKNASNKTIAQLSQEIADLAKRTRENTLKPDELAGGTFTLTNTGSRGALFDTPVVFLPQVAILGTGVVTKKPVVITNNGLDSIAIRSTAYLALSYDHRIIDGADAAGFLSAVKKRLEEGAFENNIGL